MDADFFASNRAKLMTAVGGAPVILAAQTSVQRLGDEAFPFAQEANFWYLTGVEAADWRVVMDGGRTTLIAPDVSQISQIFDGALSPAAAQKVSGADRVITSAEAAEFFRELAKKHRTAYTILPPRKGDFDFALNPGVAANFKNLKKIFPTVKDAQPTLAKLRAIKQPAEIMMLRRAINLTQSAFEIVKVELPNYTFEYEAQARFSFEFEKAGASHAYAPIVAGGRNAVTLHYGANRDGLRRGDLVLIDVGARYGGYSADVTRTYAYGDINQRARAVHAAVKFAKNLIVDIIRPGLAVREYLKKSDEIMRQVLQSLGLLQDATDFRRIFPHAISHGLGIETHDPLGRPTIFQPGMVLTVEPGIYIREENLGVRLEDDILVTATGHENLSGRLSDDF